MAMFELDRHFQGAEEFESTSPRAVGRLGVPDIMIFCCGFDDV